MLKKDLQLGEEELQLERSLRQIGQGAVLSAEEKFQMRVYLKNSIVSAEAEFLSREDLQLKKQLLIEKQHAVLSAGKRSWMRKEILEKISVPRINLVWLGRTFKTLTASALLFIFVISGVVFLPFDYRLTKASKWTYLEAVNGEVYINRGGKILAANPNVGLQEGDIIVTRANSSASVRFMDDSVTRLGEQTSIQIESMGGTSDSDLNTQVNLLLAGGRVWAHVVNLIGTDSNFVIETDNATAKATTKASFEVLSAPAVTKVAVYENTIDLSSKLDPVAGSQTIIKGFSAEVNNLQLSDSSSKITVAKIQQDSWSSQNMILDQQHQDQLLAENNTFVNNALNNDQGVQGVLADIKDLANPYFKTAEIEAARKNFLQAHLDFLKAEQIFSDSNGNRTDALKYIYTYRDFIKNLMAEKSTLEAKNKAESDQLFQLVSQHVDEQVKALAVVLPDQALYTSKRSINEISELLSTSPADLIQRKLVGLRQVLYDTEGLIDKRNFKLAESTFQQYLATLDETTGLIDQNKDQAILSDFYQVLQEQVKQLKLLSSLEVKLSDAGETYFVTVVAGVEKDSLNKLLQIITSHQDQQIPYDLLMNLYSLVNAYDDNKVEKADALGQLEKILNNYTEFKAMKVLEQNKQDQLSQINIDQSNLTTPDDGVKTMVLDFQATSEIAPAADPVPAIDPAPTADSAPVTVVAPAAS